MNKTIVLASNTSWSFVKFRLPLLIRLRAEGYHVIVVAPADSESAVFTEKGLTYVPLTKLRQKGKNPWHDYELYREFRRIYNAWRPDLAIHYTIKPNIYATKAAASLGIPCIAVITGLGYTFINGGILSRMTDLLYRSALKNAAQVWFLNRDDRQVFTARRQIVPMEKTVLIHGEGIDARTYFNPQKVADSGRDRLGRCVRFIFIGRLLYDKGVREYVSAANRIKTQYPDVEFTILGYLNVGNPSAVDVATLAKWKRGGAVQYLGSVQDVRPVLKEHDCVVLPSYREGMSTTLMEAAAMGLPLIASDIPGCREVVADGETGFLCNAKDVESLVRCMNSIIQLSPNERWAMGQRGREKMLREFDMEAIIAHYVDVIPKILTQKPK